MDKGVNKRKLQQMSILARRCRVATLYLTAKFTQDQIREQIEEEGYIVTVMTISNDIAALKEEWKRENGLKIGQWVEIELAKLNEMEQLAGSNVELRLKVLDRRAKLLGLDKPKKVELSEKPKQILDMTDQELLAIAKGEDPQAETIQ